MTVLERRVRMATAISNDLDDNDFSEMEKTFNRIKRTKKRSLKEPCTYTIEEIKAKLPGIIKEFEEDKGIPHDEVMKEYGF